ncbi:PREDICTED: uncharacterized protein LOC105569234 [Vollenhovia emeryi]|uniref:uncharacterized protein LOC105569234 n=1 Tax=Vollenhovia emeryi TaxID=411798 RepID=UPI0005F3DE99|nr:PREDICTED: uncharacterized protein LOC105569234 [Vollenhovia emeryi]
MIVDYRKHAGVPEENPYVFGINTVDKRRHAYFRACVLMRKYSAASGAKIPTSLRGTILRKHIATKCITLDISENQINDLADFMGHHEKVHKSHYRQSVVTRDLAIARLLKYAQGENATDESDDEDDEDDGNVIDFDNENDTATHSNISETASTPRNAHPYSTRQMRSKECEIMNPEKETVYDKENMINLDNEDNLNRNLNTSNIPIPRKRKQTKGMANNKDDIDSNMEIKKRKYLPSVLKGEQLVDQMD